MLATRKNLIVEHVDESIVRNRSLFACPSCSSAVSTVIRHAGGLTGPTGTVSAPTIPTFPPRHRRDAEPAARSAKF